MQSTGGSVRPVTKGSRLVLVSTLYAQVAGRNPLQFLVRGSLPISGEDAQIVQSEAGIEPQLLCDEGYAMVEVLCHPRKFQVQPTDEERAEALSVKLRLYNEPGPAGYHRELCDVLPGLSSRITPIGRLYIAGIGSRVRFTAFLVPK